MNRGRAVIVAIMLVLSTVAVPIAGAQTEDPNEPNNGLASATVATQGRYPGNITSGDKDFFKLNVNAGDVIQLEAKYDEDAGNLALEVVRPDGEDYGSSPDVVDDAQTVDTDEVVAFTAHESGTYYARVTRAGDGTAPVPFTLLYDRITPAEGDSYEPNYGAFNAAAITQGRHPAKLQAGEVDFYAIQLNNGDVLDTRLKFDRAAGSLQIEAYKPDGSDDNSKLDFVDWGDLHDDDKYVEFTAKQSTTYYLKVWGENEDTTSAPYTLLTDRIEPNETDAYEVNYNASLAAPIQEGSISAEILPSDTDYYSFSLHTGDVVNMSMYYNYSETSNLGLKVYTEDSNNWGNELEQIDSANSWDDNEALAFTARRNATYYVRVTGEDERDAGSYRLWFNRIEPVETDRFEPNFNFTLAAPITEGTQSVELLPDATDYYKTELEAGDVVKFEAHFESDVKNLDVQIYREDSEDYDNERDFIEESEDYGDTEQVAFTAKTGGTYYIAVSADNKQPPRTLNYTFNLTRVVPAEGDSYEANYDYESSAVVDGGQYPGTLLWGEEDYYVIGLQQGDILTASAVFNHSVENLDLEIYAPDDMDDGSRPEYFKRSDSYDDNEDISLTAPRTGLYYIRVYSEAEDRQPTPYDLTVSRTKNETTPLSIETQKEATLAGESVTVTYSITNTQQTAVSDATLDLGTLPGGWQILGQAPAGGTWDGIDLKWHWASINGSETKTVSITYQVPDGAVQDIEAIIGTVSAAGDISDIEPSVITVGKAEINNRPTPRFTYTPQNFTVGEPVTFDASASTDDGTISEYRWHFPNETIVSEDPFATYTFETAGKHDVSLVVEDNRSASSTTTQTVTVNEPPYAIFNVSYSVATTSITAGNQLGVTATVVNTGGSAGTANVTLYTDGTAAVTKSVTVAEGATEYLSYFVTFSTGGTHTVSVGEKDPTTINVTAPAQDGGLVGQYDTDNNGLGTTELLTGINDYRTGKIGVTDLLKLIDAWRSNT